VTGVVAHRGASLVEPENTVAAFLAAAAQGADGVELDVRRTADRRLAVHHDAHLPDGRALVDTRWADLASGGPRDLADLDAALDACRGLGLVNVEIKNWPDDIDFDPSLAVVDAVVEVLRDRPPPERAALLVSCFHLPTVDRVREQAPELATGWLVIGPGIGPHGAPIDAAGGDPLAATVTTVVDRGHRALHPHHAFVNRELVDAAHAAGVAVNTWTADEPERIVWLAETGVDAVITNVPDMALAALGRAG
jgi:glycerophosphoryl diester phosphodiesterase